MLKLYLGQVRPRIICGRSTNRQIVPGTGRPSTFPNRSWMDEWNCHFLHRRGLIDESRRKRVVASITAGRWKRINQCRIEETPWENNKSKANKIEHQETGTHPGGREQGGEDDRERRVSVSISTVWQGRSNWITQEHKQQQGEPDDGKKTNLYLVLSTKNREAPGPGGRGSFEGWIRAAGLRHAVGLGWIGGRG